MSTKKPTGQSVHDGQPEHAHIVLKRALIIQILTPMRAGHGRAQLKLLFFRPQTELDKSHNQATDKHNEPAVHYVLSMKQG